MRGDVEHAVAAIDLPVNATLDDAAVELGALHRAAEQGHVAALAVFRLPEAHELSDLAADLRQRQQRRWRREGAADAGSSVRRAAAHFETGIVNSAPLGVLSGQRCITDFCLV